MNQKERDKLILFALRRGLITFGCASGKPGGRSLTLARKAEIEKAGGKTCAIETKGRGKGRRGAKTVWYVDHTGDSSMRKKKSKSTAKSAKKKEIENAREYNKKWREREKARSNKKRREKSGKTAPKDLNKTSSNLRKKPLKAKPRKTDGTPKQRALAEKIKKRYKAEFGRHFDHAADFEKIGGKQQADIAKQILLNLENKFMGEKDYGEWIGRARRKDSVTAYIKKNGADAGVDVVMTEYAKENPHMAGSVPVQDLYEKLHELGVIDSLDKFKKYLLENRDKYQLQVNSTPGLLSKEEQKYLIETDRGPVGYVRKMQ